LEEDAYRADRDDGQDAKPDRVREVYERAVANVPPATEKRYVWSSATILGFADACHLQVLEEIYCKLLV
jgi:hypothetical protein